MQLDCCTLATGLGWTILQKIFVVCDCNHFSYYFVIFKFIFLRPVSSLYMPSGKICREVPGAVLDKFVIFLAKSIFTKTIL